MKYLLAVFSALFLITLSLNPVWSEGNIFGLLSKNKDDVNFKAAAEGCSKQAAQNNDICIHIGPEKSSNPRSQISALKKAIGKNDFSAIAISVVLSGVMAEAVEKYVNVPVITFDSPFNKKDSFAAQAYVGTDNVQFGRDLAKIIKKYKPDGGTVFLMGDMHDTNLSQRVCGVRRELSGDSDFPANKRLNGEGGWKEFKRSPWISGDDHDRTMDQLLYTFKHFKPDAFISVGHWPLINTDKYRKILSEFHNEFRNKKYIIAAGVGKVLPEYQKLLEEGLVHGFVSINFKQTGKLAYKLMKNAANGKSVPETTYVDNTIIMGR
ncbi:MAG: substrate-binding domain-containing protein [Thermodesulfobacteriota bacterium]